MPTETTTYVGFVFNAIDSCVGTDQVKITITPPPTDGVQVIAEQDFRPQVSNIGDVNGDGISDIAIGQNWAKTTLPERRKPVLPGSCLWIMTAL